MITDIFITYNDPEQVKEFINNDKLEDIKVHLLDTSSNKSRKQAFKLKSYWGAKLDPFAVVFDKDRPIKAFYTESESVITNLLSYINE